VATVLAGQPRLCVLVLPVGARGSGGRRFKPSHPDHFHRTLDFVALLSLSSSPLMATCASRGYDAPVCSPPFMSRASPQFPVQILGSPLCGRLCHSWRHHASRQR